MAKQKIYYRCQECGHISPKWMGHCPACDSWHTFEEYVEEGSSSSQSHRLTQNKERLSKPSETNGENQPSLIKDISIDESARMGSGISEFDRVLGGGFMPASLVLIGGDPGIGKSTLMLQIPYHNPDLKILYCSGEESKGQIKQRAERIGVPGDALYISSDTRAQAILNQAASIQPDLLIVDSIQSVYSEELQSMPGSQAQVRECALLFQQNAKQNNMTTVIIGHVTKEGDLAGPRLLEHMVDATLQFEGDHTHTYRILRGLKNRFGPTQEIGVFEMLEVGLKEVQNPSHWFIEQYDSDVSGNALVCSVEGERPILLEVQGLVMPSSFSVPQRTATGYDHRRLALLLAVLEKRAGYQLSGQDVYLNVAGGIRLNDTAADLAILASLTSSLLDRPILENTVMLGEIGLGGELRTVQKMEQRLGEIEKLGFHHVIAPYIGRRLKEKAGSQSLIVHECRHLSEALNTALLNK